MQDLFEMLHEVPVDVLDTLFACLEHRDRQRVRASCRAGRLLADLLRNSARIGPSWEASEAPAPDQGTQLINMHVLALPRTLYLSRLPRVTSLTVGGWDCTVDLSSLLMQYGPAIDGRIRKLELRGLDSLQHYRCDLHTMPQAAAAEPPL